MQLDVQTLLVAMLALVLALAFALPAVMGWRVSRAARCVQGSAAAQALAWASFLSAAAINDRLLSTASMAFQSMSLVLLWEAVAAWMGARPGRALLWALAVLTPLGYGVGFESYPFRVGWSNIGLALQMGIVCFAIVWRAPGAGRGWRTLVFGALAVMAAVTLWRGLLGAFFTELYPHFRAPHAVNLAAALLSPIALMLTTIGMLVAWHEEADRELRAQAHHDALTGLLNRRGFSERAAGLVAQARRYGPPLSLLMIDLDHFKDINDRLGHAAGDRALMTMARALKDSVRAGDLSCRHGGEEFCVLLTHADARCAREFDRRLRQTLRERVAQDGVPALAYSAGVATLQQDDGTLERLLARADEALYRAKAEGRGRLVLHAAMDMAHAS